MILLKKAARTIWRGKKAYVACVVLLAVGIAIYVSFNLLYLNLQAAMESMYREQRFGDAFARVRSIPLGDANQLERLEGVARVQAGLTADARVESLGQGEELITLRLSSYDPREEERLNDFVFTDGGPAGEGEILVGAPFLAANGLTIGDELTLVVAGRSLVRRVGGAVLSPEYVYTIPDSSQLMADPAAFGFALLPYGELAGLTGQTGQANALTFLLEEGVSYGEVEHRLEDALEFHGRESLVSRADQTSHTMLEMEIDQMGTMSTSMPMIFILMAVIILYIMLGRVIEQERTQIGTLKAFGYADRQILLHYMSYGGVIGVAGGLLGALGGLAMAGAMTDLYLLYFNLPGLDARFSPAYPLAGFALSVAAGCFGAYMGTRSILRLQPGEAMRPPSPPLVKSDWVARVPALRHILASSGQMALRNISRSKFRSLFVAVGVAFSFALTAFMASFSYMMDAMLIEQFTKVQTFDLKIALDRPQPYTAALEAAWAVDTVSAAEGILELPAELSLGHLRKAVAITVLDRQAELYRIYDSGTGRTLPPSAEGIVISRALADQLEAERGDILTLNSPYTGEEDLPVPVAAVIEANLGLVAYGELDSMARLLNIGRTVNQVVVNTGDLSHVKQTLLDAGNVSALTDTAAAKKVYDDMLETYASLLALLQFSGMGVAFAIITNTASISLSERSREYATLRVLGMQPGQIGQILSFEFRLLSLAGVVLGIPLTRLIKAGLASYISSDLFTFPVDTPLSCYLLAGVACLVTVELCGLSAVRHISRFNMVDVLKERE